MKKAEFVRLLRGLESTSSRRFDCEQAEFWFRAFADLPDQSVRDAVERFVLVGDPFPDIAKIRALALESIHGQFPNCDDQWHCVAKAVTCLGQAKRQEAMAQFDQLTRAAIDAVGGWDHLCEMGPQTRSTFSAQFRKAYAKLAAREMEMRSLPERLRPRIVAGNLNATNAARRAIAEPARQFIEGPSGAALQQAQEQKPTDRREAQDKLNDWQAERQPSQVFNPSIKEPQQCLS